MNPTVPLVMFGWLPLVLLIFSMMNPRRAVIAAYVLAWLFLPVVTYEVPGLPDYSKQSAASYAVLIGVLLFDAGSLRQFRWSVVDLPMAVFVLVPFLTSLSNGLGPYDGASGVVERIIIWGLPYYFARIYIRRQEHVEEVVWWLIVGGLAYVPLCLIEIRLSPQLHNWIYGFHQHSFLQMQRMGGYRPIIFMNHGLMVAMWMVYASLAATWLWHCNSRRSIGPASIGMLASGLIVTTVLVKSFGALVLLGFGLVMLLLMQRGMFRPVLLVTLAVPVFMAMRIFDASFGYGLVELFESVNERASRSLHFRLVNEEMLIGKAMDRPILGWGGWGRNRVFDVDGNDLTVTDGAWVIVLGKYGLVGLASWLLIFLLPVIKLVRRRTSYGSDQPPIDSACWAIALMLLLHVIDSIPNDMSTPIVIFCAGALASIVSSEQLSSASRVSSVQEVAGSQSHGAPLRLDWR